MTNLPVSSFPKAVELSGESLQKAMHYLHKIYAYVELKQAGEEFSFVETPTVYSPKPTLEDEKVNEFVYTIYDYGDRLLASKIDDLQPLNANMLKMYFTIEKMITLWSEKIAAYNASAEKPLSDWMFFVDGYELCKRKVFEVIINHTDNWIILNYDPGNWGNTYLNTLKLLNEKQFPYPSLSPRDVYRHKLGEPSTSVQLNR